MSLMCDDQGSQPWAQQIVSPVEGVEDGGLQGRGCGRCPERLPGMRASASTLLDGTRARLTHSVGSLSYEA
jgi:hypothetical protein